MKRQRSTGAQGYPHRRLDLNRLEITSSRTVSPGASDGSWSTIDESILYTLVALLKTDKFWKHDVASLRLLNSHWRKYISHYVDVLDPQSCRLLSESEALSVDQFLFLTSVNAIPFIKRGLCDPYRAHCVDFFGVLIKLSFLRHICVDKRALTMVTAEVVRGLQGLESVEVVDGPVAAESLIKLATASLKELVVRGVVHGLTAFLERVPCLEHLDVELADFGVEEALALREIKNVGLTMRSLIFTSASSALPEAQPYVVDRLLDISGLERLYFVVKSPDVLSTTAFKDIATKLTSLDVSCSEEAERTHTMPAIASTMLESLSLQHCNVEGENFMRDTPNLITLSLNSCRLWRGQNAFESLTRLKTLRLSTGFRSSPGTDVWLQHIGLMTGLKHLDLSFELEYGTPGEYFLKQMMHLSELQSIVFRCLEKKSRDWEFSDGFAFDIFQFSIGALPHLKEIALEGWGYRRRLEKIMDMHFITQLEKLHLVAVVNEEDRDVFEQHVQRVRDAAPWMRFEAIH